MSKIDVDALQIDTEEAIAAWLHDDAEFAFRPNEDEAADAGRELLKYLVGMLSPEEFAALKATLT